MDITIPFIPAWTTAWVIIPLLIILARITDVSLDTIRVIFISKGLRFLASVLGFFSVLVWIIVITSVIKHLDHPVYYIAYALGYGLGNYIGMTIERKIHLGYAIVTIITDKESKALLKVLATEGFVFTASDTISKGGPSKMIFSVIQKKRLNYYMGIVKTFVPDAFYTIEDVRSVSKDRSVVPICKNKWLDKLRLGRSCRG
ncbi:MAG: DUF5698 domain-containing protein [Proteobacteria bacterium]|nr:DUF5698 domain-containing protein [Pseudomonadota bacterium]